MESSRLTAKPWYWSFVYGLGFKLEFPAEGLDGAPVCVRFPSNVGRAYWDSNEFAGKDCEDHWEELKTLGAKAGVLKNLCHRIPQEGLPYNPFAIAISRLSERH